MAESAVLDRSLHLTQPHLLHVIYIVSNLLDISKFIGPFLDIVAVFAEYPDLLILLPPVKEVVLGRLCFHLAQAIVVFAKVGKL